MQHVFIINPAAGKSEGKQKVYDMAESLRQNHGLSVQCILTKRQGHATELVKEICSKGDEVRFYACGGDGTVNEVANGILGFDNASMTVIPIGTGNDFLKNFGDKAPLFMDADNLWDGPTFDLDTIDVNGRAVLTIACAGIDARVAADVHQYSESPLLNGKTSYVASLVVNFLLKDIGRHWTLTIDDEVIEKDFALICCSNGRYYGGGFMPIAEARMDDGILDVLTVDKISKISFAMLVGHYSKGEWRECGNCVHYYTPKKLSISSEKKDITVCMDGETYESDTVTIQLSDKKIHFFGPEDCDPNATARPRI